ncbi:MAG: hypothetical protein LIO85_08860 [Rikenellaceae bacterium]|nr:hypothetical protein [Rikenellaceae bacterium]
MTRLIISILAVSALLPYTNGGVYGAATGEKGTYFYRKFDPAPAEPVPYKDLVTDYCYLVDGVTVSVGYYAPGPNGIFSVNDNPYDWGDRLLCFDPDGELIYSGRGVSDVYLYEPHFFTSPDGGEVFILCQLAYEYWFGADVFLLRGGEMEFIGRLSVESTGDEDGPMTGFVVIERRGDTVRFTFPVERLVYDPGDTCVEMENRGYKYIYREGELIWTGPID